MIPVDFVEKLMAITNAMEVAMRMAMCVTDNDNSNGRITLEREKTDQGSASVGGSVDGKAMQM